MSYKFLAESLANPNSHTDELPPILWRNKWSYYTERYGLPFARGTMQNRDSKGIGPKAGKAGKKIFYLREDYLSWLASLSTD